MPTSLSNTFQIKRAVPGAYVTYRDREVVKILAVHDGGDYYTVETESGEVQTTVEHLSALWPDFGHCVWLESGDLHLTIKMGLDADTALPLGRRDRGRRAPPKDRRASLLRTAAAVRSRGAHGDRRVALLVLARARRWYSPGVVSGERARIVPLLDVAAGGDAGATGADGV